MDTEHGLKANKPWTQPWDHLHTLEEDTQKYFPRCLPKWLKSLSDLPWMGYTARHIAPSQLAACSGLKQLACPKNVRSSSHSGVDTLSTLDSKSLRARKCVCVYTHSSSRTQGDQGVAARVGTQPVQASMELSPLNPGPQWGTARFSSRSYSQG